jgi:hypothetical protein
VPIGKRAVLNVSGKIIEAGFVIPVKTGIPYNGPGSRFLLGRFLAPGFLMNNLAG